MKLEIKEKPTKNFYNEILYVQTNYKKILKNPSKKVKKLTTSILLYLLTALVAILISLYFYMQDKPHNIFQYYAFFFLILFIFAFFYLLLVNRRLNQLVDYSKKNQSTISIDNNNISLIKDKSTVSITWDSLQSIVINKYSIIFLPKDISSLYIAINTEYKEEILKVIKKYKKEKLIQDNNK